MLRRRDSDNIFPLFPKVNLSTAFHVFHPCWSWGWPELGGDRDRLGGSIHSARNGGEAAAAPAALAQAAP